MIYIFTAQSGARGAVEAKSLEEALKKVKDSKAKNAKDFVDPKAIDTVAVL